MNNFENLKIESPSLNDFLKWLSESIDEKYWNEERMTEIINENWWTKQEIFFCKKINDTYQEFLALAWLNFEETLKKSTQNPVWLEDNIYIA